MAVSKYHSTRVLGRGSGTNPSSAKQPRGLVFEVARRFWCDHGLDFAASPRSDHIDQ